MPFSFLSVLGAALAWIVILAAGAASGFGGAYAWQRWGRDLDLVSRAKGLLQKDEKSPFERDVEQHLAEKEQEAAEAAALQETVEAEAAEGGTAPTEARPEAAATAAPDLHHAPDDYWVEAWIVHHEDHPGQGVETSHPVAEPMTQADEEWGLYEEWNAAQEESVRTDAQEKASPGPTTDPGMSEEDEWELPPQEAQATASASASASPAATERSPPPAEDGPADTESAPARQGPRIRGIEKNYVDPEETPVDEERGVRVIRFDGMPTPETDTSPGDASEADTARDGHADADAEDGDADAPDESETAHGQDEEARAQEAADAPYWPEGVEREGEVFATRSMAAKRQEEEDAADLSKIRRVYGAAGAPFGPGAVGPTSDETHPNEVPADDEPIRDPAGRTVHRVAPGTRSGSPWMPGTEAEPNTADAPSGTRDDASAPSASETDAPEATEPPAGEADEADGTIHEEPAPVTPPSIAFGLDPSLMRPPRPSEVPQPPSAPKRPRRRTAPQTADAAPTAEDLAAMEAPDAHAGPVDASTPETDTARPPASDLSRREEAPPEPAASTPEPAPQDTPPMQDPATDEAPTTADDPAQTPAAADAPAEARSDHPSASTASPEDELLAAGWEEVEDETPTETAPVTPPPSPAPSSTSAPAPRRPPMGRPGPLAPARPPVHKRPAAPTPAPAPAPTLEPTGDDDATSAPLPDVDTSGPASIPATAIPAGGGQGSQISRSEAIEELTAIYELDYEDGVALVNAGLWGFENHDEWVRAMRAGSRAPGVDPEVLKKVLNTPMRDIQPELKKLREKRAWTSIFENLWGVGPEEASALYDAGFEDLDALKEASTDKLARVPGVGTARAFQIKASLHDLAPDDGPGGDEKVED